MNYFSLIKDVLNEKNKSILDLEKDKIIKKNIFYEFKYCCPSLDNIISIANYLEVSIDYIFEKTTQNRFQKYKTQQDNIYKKLIEILQTENISQVKFCKDLGISRTNFSRWKNGAQPKLSTIIDITNYLNLTIDDLLERE